MGSVKDVVSWRVRTKLKSIVYKGGSCISCGYNRSVYSMHFHHIDPAEKDFKIAGSTRSWERIQKELDKCVLLCSNCHGEHHEDILDLHEHLHRNPTPEEGMRLLQEANLIRKPTPPKACSYGTPTSQKATRCQPCYHKSQRSSNGSQKKIFSKLSLEPAEWL